MKTTPRTIYQIIKAAKEQSPDNICILNEQKQYITYAEIYQHLQDTKKTLRGYGVSNHDCIAIVLPNGPEMASCFLTFCCCATTAPLNPLYRESEYEFYLTDLGAKILVVQENTESPARKVAEKLNIPILELIPDKTKPGIFTLSGSFMSSVVAKEDGFCEKEDIALVLHTSGTTSRPKIVPLSHQNICASATNIMNTLQLTEKDRCLNVMPLFHIHGLMGALLSSIAAGASIICSTGFDHNHFFRWVEDCCPTWYTAVPTMHQSILSNVSNHLEIIKKSQIRFIRSSSSSLPPIVLAELEKSFCVPVIESYGMTEASHQMTSNPLTGKRKPGSVGMPAGPQVGIMDKNNNLLGTGIEGEIVIRGENVTLGYVRNPEANKIAFSAGWFRTGDIGYFDQDNYLYIKGRLKEIINRGGEKVSPREVDEALLGFAGIRQAVTFAFPHPRLGEDVVAAVILKENSKATEQEIRDFLFITLAEFKIPSQIIFVEKIPLGPTGKMQRVGLADKLGHLFKVAYSEANTDNEKFLVRLWAQILNVPQIGIHDNFFILGGDSLLGIQIINRTNEQLQLSLPVEILFRTPTIYELSLQITSAQKKHINHITPIPRNQKIPLSFAQETVWYFDVLIPNCRAYNRPLKIYLTGNVNVTALEESLSKLIERHEVLRTTIDISKSEAFQKIHTRFCFTFPTIDLSSFCGEEKQIKIDTIVCAEAKKKFNLQEDLMMRALLMCLDEEEYLLCLVFHHIVFDGWSNSIYLRDLAELYSAINEKKLVHLQPLTLQYADFAYWQRQQDYQEKLSYWQQKMSNYPALMQIPKDKIAPQVSTYGGDEYSFTINANLYQKLKQISQQHKVSIFATMFAAYAVLLWKYSGQEDIVVGVPFSERNSLETENLVGIFINTLPLRVSISGKLNFIALIKQIHTISLEAHEHQVPLQQIIKAIEVDRTEKYSASFFQTLFIFENFPLPPKKFSNVKVEQQEVKTQAALVDIFLEITVNEKVQAYFKYATDLFYPETIKRIAHHFEELLQSIAANPQQSIQKLNMLTVEEKQQILFDFNNTQIDYSRDKTIHQLFEEQQKYKNNQSKTFALLPNQKSMLILEELHPETSKNILFCYTIRGGIEVAIFKLCLQQLIQEYDGLRTVITNKSILVAEQQILESLEDIPFVYFDVSGEEGRESKLMDIIRKYDETPGFDEILWNTFLVKLKEEKFVWGFNISHIIADGYSQVIIAQRMSLLYEEYRENKNFSVKKQASITEYFQDYFLYEKSEQYKIDKEYWQKYFQKIIRPISFYGKKNIEKIAKDNIVKYKLPKEKVEKMHNILLEEEFWAKTEKIRVFNFIATVCIVYLYHIGNREEICIGFPYHNRKKAEYKNIPGFFIAILPLVISIEDNDTFISIYKKVSKQIQNQNQHSQFPVRNTSRKYDYDFILNYQSISLEKFAKYPMTVKRESTNYSAHAMIVGIYNYSEGIYDFRFGLRKEIFSQPQLVIEHFMNIFDAAIDNPQQKIQNVSCLSKIEYQKIIHGFNQQKNIDVSQITLKQLLEKQSCENIAIYDRETHITYSSLHKKANQLARTLQKHMQQNEVIAIYTHRDINTMIGILAIIKAGGIYCPIDPQYPIDRVHYILINSQAQIVLSSQQEELPHENITFIQMEPSIFIGKDDNLPDNINMTDFVYMIYTSGSTGLPKGVAITNKNILPVLSWTKKYWQLGSHTKVLQNLSFAFDFCILEIFSTLLCGGTLYLLPQTLLQDSFYIVDFINQKQINTLHTTPAFMEMLVTPQRKLPSINIVHLGGDKVSLDLIERIYLYSSAECGVYDGYGVTEATINSTIMYWDKNKLTEYKKENITTIGKICSGFSLYIVDKHLQPVPVGVAGELLIGGDSVANGYWRQPELTKSKFIADTFSGKGKLYRTGDVARYLADGSIEFIGRKDNQVKIRGFRIELGEIENQLQQHENVKQAVAILKQKPQKLLIAYLVCYEQQKNFKEKILNHLQSKLPEYMIPSIFIILDEMPFTLNGKIDRKALLQREHQLAIEVSKTPRTENEKILIEVWQSLLEVKNISVEDNFFKMGGDSILSIQLIAKAAQKGLYLSVRNILQNQRLKDMAQCAQKEKSSIGTPQLEQDDIVVKFPSQNKDRAPFFFFPGVGGIHYLFDFLQKCSSARECYGFQHLGLDDKSQPHTTIESMANYYVSKIKEVQPLQSEYYLGGHSIGANIAFEVARKLIEEGKEIKKLILMDRIPTIQGKKCNTTQVLKDMVTLYENFYQKKVDVNQEIWEILDDNEKIKKAYEIFQEMGFLAKHQNLEHFQKRLDVYKIQREMNYFPQNKKYSTSVTLFRSVEHKWSLDLLPTLGWEEYFDDIEVLWVEGNHFTMLQETNNHVICEYLKRKESIDSFMGKTKEHFTKNFSNKNM